MLEAIMEGLIEGIGEFFLELVLFNKHIPKVIRLTIVSAIFLPLIVVMGVWFSDASSIGERLVVSLLGVIVIMGYLTLAGKVFKTGK